MLELSLIIKKQKKRIIDNCNVNVTEFFEPYSNSLRK